MINRFSVFTFMGALLLALFALPAQAEMLTVSDEDLAQISGMANVSNVVSDSTLDMQIGSVGTGTHWSGDGNIQVGYYQWFDNHSGDLSFGKGSNLFRTTNSPLSTQRNVVAMFNSVTWGASVDNAAITGSLTGTSSWTGTGGQVVESWATMFVGGF